MNPAIEIYQILVEDSTYSYKVIKRSAVVLEEGGRGAEAVVSICVQHWGGGIIMEIYQFCQNFQELQKF